MSHFLLETVAGPRILLPDDEAHHATRVLRLREGDPVSGTDGLGGLVHGKLVFEPAPAIEVIERLEVARPAPPLAVAFALTKGDRPELAVEKLTELGVDRIVAWTADRSVVRWNLDKRRQNGDRFRGVARAALKQSRRSWLPSVEDPTDLDGVIAGANRLLVFDLGAPPLPASLSNEPVTIVIGPEGGFSDEERELLRDADAGWTGLTGGVLRAETAAIVAAALAIDRLGRWAG